MNNWTIGKKIVSGFALVIAITGLLGAFAYNRLTGIRSSADRVVNDALLGVSSISHMESNAKGQYIALLRHIASTNAQEMAQLEAVMQQSREENAKISEDYEKTINDPRDRELFDAAKAARPAYVGAFEEVLKLSREFKPEEAGLSTARVLDPAYRKYMAAVEASVKFNKENGDRLGASIMSLAGSAVIGVIVGSLSALVAGLGIAFYVSRGISKTLSTLSATLDDGANQVASAAGQVSASSQSLAEGASEQAASLEETSASLEEMSSMTKRNAENAETAKTLANQTRTAADNGASDMREMTSAMDAIKTSSDNIAKIIKTIDEIAFQTNILALNAAVEAARAGEAGMGFAVVADEVRNLAQRSAQAAKETAEKIEDSIRKSDQGVHISAKVGQSLSEIVEKARRVDELVAEIATASREQNQGIQQVNTAVTQMDKVTQSNAANAEESASASEELNAQAATLKDAVEELTQLVGGRALSAKARPDAVRSPATKVTRPATAKIHLNGTATKRSASNGSGAHEPVLAKARNGAELPMEGSFRDF